MRADGLQDVAHGDAVEVLHVPLPEQLDPCAHVKGLEPLHHVLELVPGQAVGQGAVAVLLADQEAEAGAHGDPLAVVQLLQADGGGQVVVSGLVPAAPPHVHHLELHTVPVPGGLGTLYMIAWKNIQIYRYRNILIIIF